MEIALAWGLLIVMLLFYTVQQGPQEIFTSFETNPHSISKQIEVSLVGSLKALESGDMQYRNGCRLVRSRHRCPKEARVQIARNNLLPSTSQVSKTISRIIWMEARLRNSTLTGAAMMIRFW